MRAWIGLTVALGTGCSVSDRATSIENDVPYACEANRDCSVGSCLAEFGVCARDDGDVMTVLFEVTPSASDPIYGGARYLVEQNLSVLDLTSAEQRERNEMRGVKPGRLELNLPPRVPVSGSIAVDPQTTCVSRPIARSTLPATLFFTPCQRLLGLDVSTYEMATRYDDEIEEFVFQGSLPPGEYDVYMRPMTERLSAGCAAIPQIFRNLPIGGCSEAERCEQSRFELKPPASRPLRLTIPWRPELEGWLVDMVHPVTGELISNRVELTAADVVADQIVARLNYSPLDPATEFISGAAELVRLTPREGFVAGTVLLQRSALEFDPGQGEVGDVSTFGATVNYQAWVWKKDERDSPVSGVVSFAALDLDDVDEGVLVSFARSAEVDERGQVNVELLPGRYRVRVTPPALDDPAQGLLAGVESTLTVWPSAGGGSQAGHVIQVPPAVTVQGAVVAEQGNAPLRGVEVRAIASNLAEPCAGGSTMGEAQSADSSLCAPVLREALARDPYVPRTRSSLSDGSGGFFIDGLDCGSCQPGSGATFDLSVRPGHQSRLAWWVRRALQVDSSVLMEPLEMPTPVALPVQLTYANPIAEDAETPTRARGLPGALVRVFALLDNESQVIFDTEGLDPCITISNPDGRRCVQSLLQVAEVRSGQDGEFLLLLPPRIE